MLCILNINIDNINKYKKYQSNSENNSLNFDGYQKVIFQESTKVIIPGNNHNKELRFDEKIIINSDIDDTKLLEIH